MKKKNNNKTSHLFDIKSRAEEDYVHSSNIWGMRGEMNFSKIRKKYIIKRARVIKEDTNHHKRVDNQFTQNSEKSPFNRLRSVSFNIFSEYSNIKLNHLI